MSGIVLASGQGKEVVRESVMNFVTQENIGKHDDSDDDFGEFVNADIEEAEDRIYKEYKKVGQLDETEIKSLARTSHINMLD